MFSLPNNLRGEDDGVFTKHQKRASHLSNVEGNHIFKPMSQKTQMQRLNQFDINDRLAQLEAIINSSEDAILSKNLDGIITSWNPAAEKMYRYGAKEMIGRSISLLFPIDKKAELDMIMSRLRQGLSVDHYNTVRLRSDGKKINVSICVSPIRGLNNQIVGACVITRDISDRIELEQRKDDFISLASHEFKTPLTTLKGFSQIILQKPNDLDPSNLNYLQKMDQQIDKLNQLVDDLLDVAKIQTEEESLRKESFWINELIEQIVVQMQQLSHQHRIIIKSNPKLSAVGDKEKISQVLINLLTNAIKYSPQANKIVITVQQIKDEIVVSVQDFGIGIFSKDRLKIFDRFYQAKNKIRESFSGLGLGLFISSKIIQLHNGKIWVKSNKGEGSTFCFSLPISQNE